MTGKHPGQDCAEPGAEAEISVCASSFDAALTPTDWRGLIGLHTGRGAPYLAGMSPKSPHQVILDVLANSRVKAEHSHAEIAQQILDCFAVCRITVTTQEDRARELQTAKAPARSWVEQLSYRIEHRDAGDRVLEVLGREHEATPARAAFAAYREKYPDKLLMLIEGGGRLIARSDREA